MSEDELTSEQYKAKIAELETKLEEAQKNNNDDTFDKLKNK